MKTTIELLKQMIGVKNPKTVLTNNREGYSDELYDKQQIVLKEALLALEKKEDDKKQSAIGELDELEKRFKVIAGNGFATPRLAIEYVGFIIDKRRKELVGGKTQ